MLENVRFHVVTRYVFLQFPHTFFRSCGELEVVNLAWWRNLNVNEVIPASAGIVPSSYRQEYCAMPPSFFSLGHDKFGWNQAHALTKIRSMFFNVCIFQRWPTFFERQPLYFVLIYTLCLAIGYEKLLHSGMVSGKLSIFYLNSRPVCNWS